VTGSKIGTVNHLMLTYEHARQKNLKLKGFLVNQNVSDGYELSNLKHQIFGLTGHKVFGAIPFQKSFNIESYVENFLNFVDISDLGLENI
jgi:dethiobiotin synthetase